MRTVTAVVVACAVVLAGGIASLDAQQAARFSLPDIPSPKVALEPPEVGRYGGTLITTVFGEPRTFNLLLAPDGATEAALLPITESLAERNYITGELEPGLTEPWHLSGDKRAWTFTLRRGIRWSDGQPLTVDDVAFTLQAVFTDRLPNLVRDQLTFEGKPMQWQVLDAQRIRFMTDQPVAFFPPYLPILPKHRLADVLARGPSAFGAFWGINTPPKDIVGTGPFVLQSYVPTQRLTYLRNPHYWKVDRAGNRLPYLTRMVMLIVPNVDAARLLFLARQVDTYTPRPREYAELKQGERAGNYTVLDGPEAYIIPFFVLNQNPKGLAPPKLAWFQDVRFRRALNHAIDRNTIINQVYAGRATPAWGPVSPGLPLFFHPRLQQYPYDINRAQQLLAEAGYRKDRDGVLRDADGNAVEFVLTVTAANLDFLAIAGILRQDFARLGVRATLASEAAGVVSQRLLVTYNWEAAIVGQNHGFDPGARRFIWLSSGVGHLWHPKQERPATPWEAEIDRLFERAARELDVKRRQALYYQWQEIVAEQLPMMPLAYPKTQLAVRNTLGNLTPTPQLRPTVPWVYYRVPYRE